MKNLQIKILGIILLATFVLFIAGCETQNITPSSDFGAKKFTGSEDLINFLKARQGNDYYNIGYGGIGRTEVMMKTTSQTSISSDSNAAAPTSGGGSNEFSQTNIQVQGVDEPDLVKNDDKYIYKATNGNITIIDAYPAENAKIISIININGTANEIFVNGNKLVVFGMENYVYYNEPMPLVQSSANLKIAIDSRIMPIYYSPKSFIKVYDISDKNNPVIFNSITYDGDYYDARMIDEYIYVIVNQPINYNNDIIAYPSIIREGKTMSIMPTDIYYFNVYDYSYRLTTVMSLKIDEKSDPTINTFLTGYTQNIFVSKNNIYLTSMKQLSPLEYQEIQRQKMIKPILEIVDSKTAQKIRDTMNKDLTTSGEQAEIAQIIQDYYNRLSKSEKEDFQNKSQSIYDQVQIDVEKQTQKTLIYKISIDGTNIEYKSMGEVPGNVLNQFSMDEYNNYFRIATTSGETWTGTSENNLYVLDSDLNLVGKIEGLGKTERIYSVRFMGNRAYMVTFKNTDPLFVIDLSNPTNPKVLGELKIPGYSNYLHPYDETHIIGVGKDATEFENQTYALYQGMKLALFDVSDVNNPKEISHYNIGDRGTDSDALYDHKAFLFDKSKELLVIPINLYEINKAKYPNIDARNAYGTLTFQGAYVFGLNLNDGFTLKGRISHEDKNNTVEGTGTYYSEYDYQTQIQRSLYMDNIIYTISESKVMANDLTTLSEIKTINLPIERYQYGPYYGGVGLA